MSNGGLIGAALGGRRRYRRWLDRWSRARLEQSLDDELRFHLEMEEAQSRARGLGAREARRRARVRLGGVESVKQACREERRGAALERLLDDGRSAWRAVRRQRGQAVGVLVTLACGVGVATAFVQLAYGVLVQPLPVAREHELALLWRGGDDGPRSDRFSLAEAAILRDGLTAVEGIAEYHGMSFIVRGLGDPRRVQTGVVSPGYFELLGVRPALGRSFVPADEGHEAEPVLLVSHRFWRDALDGDPSVVGRELEMNDRRHRVIGVLPPMTEVPWANDVYMPTSACPFRAAGVAASWKNPNVFRNLTLIVRRSVDRPEDVLRAEIDALSARFANAETRVDVVPLRSFLDRRARPLLALLALGGGLVLLIASTNTATLTLAQRLRRRPELALRRALGAGFRLHRQHVLEGLVVGVVGGVGGSLVAWLSIELAGGVLARIVPRVAEVRFGWSTASVALALGIFVGTSAALFSFAVAGRRPTVGPRKASVDRVHRLLVAVQAALAVALLLGAGATLHSAYNLIRLDPGFSPQIVSSATLHMDWRRYPDIGAARRLAIALRDAVGLEPGIEAVGIAGRVPLADGPVGEDRFEIEHRSVAAGSVRAVDRGYFDALLLTPTVGRLPEPADQDDQVAVVSASLAHRAWGTGNPIGKRLRHRVDADDPEAWFTVIGVVPDTHQRLDRPAAAEVYVPAARFGAPGRLVVRSTLDPSAVAATLRAALDRLDPDQALGPVRTLEQDRQDTIAPSRLLAVMLAVFALFALVLTAGTIASMQAYAVARRHHEIGIRMALGATPRAIRRSVTRTALAPAAAGILVGLGSVPFATQILSGLVHGTSPADPAIIASAVLGLLAVAAASAYVPALRAAAIDPTGALRAE